MGLRRAYGAMALAVVCVSFASILFRWSESPPLVKAFYRLALAAAVLAPVAALGLLRGPRVTRRDVALMALTGVILAGHFGTWVTSLSYTTVASSTLLVSVHPLVVGLASHYLFREKVTTPQALGIALGFGGVVIIALGDYGGPGEGLEGDFLALVGGILAGFYLLAGRRLRQRLDLIPYAFTVYAFAAASLLVALIAGAGLGWGPGPFPTASTHGLQVELALFLALAVVSSIGGHTLYNWVLKRVPAAVVSLSLLGEPLGASLLALGLLGERPGASVLVGGPVALVGLYLAARPVGTGKAQAG